MWGAGCGLAFLWCWHGALKVKPRTMAGRGITVEL